MRCRAVAAAVVALCAWPGTALAAAVPGTEVVVANQGADVLVVGSQEVDRLAGGAGHARIGGAFGPDQETPVGEDDDDDWSLGDALLSSLAVVVVLTLVFGIIPLAQRIFPRRPRVELRTSSEESPPPPLGEWLPYLLPFPVLGIVGVGLYSFDEGASVFAAALLTAGGALLAGGLFGFLFGIPKSLAKAPAAAEAASQRRFDPNTNLEEISDWLTKIIVGLTLIQLDELVDRLQDLADFLAPSLGGGEGADAYAIAILMVFGISGFLIAYMATRLYVGRAFATAEGNVVQAVVRVRQAADPTKATDTDARFETFRDKYSP